MEQTTQKRNFGDTCRRVFRICPVRHILLLAGILVIALYFLLRGNQALMYTLSEKLVRPYHQLAGRVCSIVPFSVAELLYAIVIAGVLIYIIYSIVLLIHRGGKARRVYRSAVTLVTLVAVLYAGFCALWGVYYYADSFAEKIGLESAPISTEELETVTAYFACLATAYGEQVQRDEDGLFTADEDSLFDRGETLYRAVSAEIPALGGPELRPKPMFFSYLMSYINFTGFFFPFTGEANLNVHSPQCMLPSTIAHELAHQRGVAREDEANFVAVLACMESGDPEYCYSAALLAYTHLGNALYSADREAWSRAASALSQAVWDDLSANNAYWAGFETKAAEATGAVYTGFLQSHGQELGMRSYGACVDLLVAYYYEEAEASVVWD